MSEEKIVSWKDLTFDEESAIKEVFLDGKLFSGVCVDYYDNGQKRYEGKFKNGKKDGRWITWYENGQKETEGYYTNWKEEGLWTEWYDNGQKMRERTYKDGTRITKKVWSKDGK